MACGTCGLGIDRPGACYNGLRPQAAVFIVLRSSDDRRSPRLARAISTMFLVPGIGSLRNGRDVQAPR